ncbi:MAG TPA: acylneuraminate cytidylyltransferase family protein [Patescibacteria group bacterium]|nr:acylneuraminate cytidylyltransferase family protein [Patescibacteria group bacterium]
MMKKTIVAIIPARGGSKSIPHKNIADLGGFPLMAYSIAAAKLSKRISRVIVSTDDKSIAKIALKYGAEVPFLRPKKISKDTSTDKEFFLHAINWFKANEGHVPDLMVHLRPTTPLRSRNTIDKAILIISRNKKATSLRSVHANKFPTPFKMAVIRNKYLKFFGGEYFNADKEYYNFPRQKLPKTYIPNGVVDIVRPSVVLGTGLLHGDKIASMITENVSDIDSVSDLALARIMRSEHKYKYLLSYLRKTKNA